MMGGKLKNGLPDVVIVRKSYPYARKRSRNRNWKLKSMAKTEDLEGRTKTEKLNAEKDYELFLRDVEEDVELRGMMNLFKDGEGAVVKEEEMVVSEEEPEDDFPEINMEELLDEFQEMGVSDEEMENLETEE
jgi:nonsense-mediated mRNA decay protein 3